jgi:2,3-bisphosphoglycerate-independent phosphoglycerate mutase
MAKNMGIKKLFIHAFLDGRDTPPENGIKYIEKLLSKIKEIGIGQISTIMGRYYAMDRDNRWERVERAYKAMVEGVGKSIKDPLIGLKESYNKGITDEFVEPMVLADDNNSPLGKIEDGDSIISFNFRADRIREITKALTLDDFAYFNRNKKPNIFYTCMTEYEKGLDLPVVFSPISLVKILADIFKENNVKNLRIAETEKYAHVTYFFNGGVEEKFLGEDRILIPSPKVSTYDLKPEMSAYEVTNRVIKEIKSKKYDVIILNYANPDMVGHTGNLNAAIKAIEIIDSCLGEVIDTIKEEGGISLITADHGNAEIMIDPDTGEPHTAHTTNKVPFIIVDDGLKKNLKKECALKDVAPTILSLMGIEKPKEMTGVDIRE